MRQLHEGRAEIEIAYTRGVAPEGNQVAVAAINEVFHTVDATWRGLGVIPGSGYAIRPEFAEFVALCFPGMKQDCHENPPACLLVNVFVDTLCHIRYVSGCP